VATKTDQNVSKIAIGTTIRLLLATLFSLTMPLTAQAEQPRNFGDYTVHYTAFTTDNLTPSVARAYNIPRSKKRALLNVSVLKKTANDSSRPTRASIKGTTTSPGQQLRELSLREISEKGTIYYIAETPVVDAETLKYSLEIIPEGETTAYRFSFQEQF